MFACLTFLDHNRHWYTLKDTRYGVFRLKLSVLYSVRLSLGENSSKYKVLKKRYVFLFVDMGTDFSVLDIPIQQRNISSKKQVNGLLMIFDANLPYRLKKLASILVGMKLSCLKF